MEARVLQWADRLRAIAQTGIAFSPSRYDVERYEEILKVSAEMESAAEGHAADPQFVASIFERLRADVGADVQGYVTPKVGAGAIVFNAHDELLLIDRSDGRGWFPPVGFADVGYTPAQIAVKETREETGLEVTPLRLVGIYDNRLQGGNPRIHLYRILFYCRLDGGELRPHPLEAKSAGFFAADKLPQPLAGNPRWVEHAFAAHRGELNQPYFDR